jgi:hypothetical protein
MRLPTAVMIAMAVAGSAILLLAGCSGGDKPQPSAAPPTIEPLNGEYTASFGPQIDLSTNKQIDPATATGTFEFRSACRSSGCVAATNMKAGPALAQQFAFDKVGERWIAVGVVPRGEAAQRLTNCRNGTPGDVWEVFKLLEKPDGTLAGEYTAFGTNNCNTARTVTMTRVGNGDLSRVPDPALLLPRVVSAAEGLFGRYSFTSALSNGRSFPAEQMLVQTNCLRTGDRCMSFLYSAEGTRTAAPLVFAGGRWTWDEEGENSCRNDGTLQHTKITADFPLPMPVQDPIPLLTGHGRLDTPADVCPSGDFEGTFARTGD